MTPPFRSPSVVCLTWLARAPTDAARRVARPSCVAPRGTGLRLFASEDA